MNYAYLILHYKNLNDTVKCIDSIYKISPKGKIIIVDNGSKDGSGELLAGQYNNDRCKVILLDENLGFSKGNNAGYKWIKENLNIDYLIVANNDVVFFQNDFEKKIDSLYKRTSFHVLGPDVFIPKHSDHQNPMFKNGITIEQLKKELDEYRYYEKNPKKFRRRLILHAFKNMICSNNRFVRGIYSMLRGKDNLDYRKEYADVGLQGSCLIVSKQYIQNEDKMFSPEPFLYEEEVFFFYKCRKKEYKIVYSPLIVIKHEEGASFKNASRNTEEKLKFMLKHHVIAREQLLDYLKNEVDLV